MKSRYPLVIGPSATTFWLPMWLAIAGTSNPATL